MADNEEPVEVELSNESGPHSTQSVPKNLAEVEMRRVEMKNYELEQRLLSADGALIEAKKLEFEKINWPHYVRVDDWKNVVTSGKVPSWLDEPIDKGVYQLVDTGDEDTPVPFSKEWEDQVLANKPVVVSGRDLRQKYERKQTMEAWNNFDEVLGKFKAACDGGEGELTLKGLEKFISIGGITPNEREQIELAKRLELIQAEEAARENQNQIDSSKALKSGRQNSSKQQKRLKAKNRRDGKNKIPTRLMANPPPKGPGPSQKLQKNSANKKQPPSASVFKRLSKPDLTKPSKPWTKPPVPVRQVPAKPKETSAINRRMEYWQKLQVTQKFHKDKMKRLAMKIPDKLTDEKETGPLGKTQDIVDGSKISLRTKEWVETLVKPKPEEIEKKKTSRKSVASVVDSEAMADIFKSVTPNDSDSTMKVSLSDRMTSEQTSIKTGQLSKSMSISESRFVSDIEKPSKVLKPQFGKAKQPHPLRVAKKNSKQFLGKSKPEANVKSGNTHKKLSKSGSKIKQKPEKIQILANADTVLSLFEKIPAAYEQPSVQEVPPLPYAISSAEDSYDNLQDHNPIYEYIYDEEKSKARKQNSTRQLIGRSVSEKMLTHGLEKPKKTLDKIKSKGKPKKENVSGKGSALVMSPRDGSQIVHTVVSSEVEWQFVDKPSKTKSIAKRLGQRPRASTSGIIHTVKTELPARDVRVPSPSPRTLLNIATPRDGDSGELGTSSWIPLKPKKAKPAWNLSHPKESNIYTNTLKGSTAKKSSTNFPKLKQKNTIQIRNKSGQGVKSGVTGTSSSRLDEFVVSKGVRQVSKVGITRKPSKSLIPKVSKPDAPKLTGSRPSAVRSGSGLKMNKPGTSKAPARLPTPKRNEIPRTLKVEGSGPQTGKSLRKGTAEANKSTKTMPKIKLPPMKVVTIPKFPRTKAERDAYYGYRPQKKMAATAKQDDPYDPELEKWVKTEMLPNYDPDHPIPFPGPGEPFPQIKKKAVKKMAALAVEKA